MARDRFARRFLVAMTDTAPAFTPQPPLDTADLNPSSRFLSALGDASPAFASASEADSFTPARPTRLDSLAATRQARLKSAVDDVAAHLRVPLRPTGATKPAQWTAVVTVFAMLGLAAGVFGYAYSQIHANNVKEAALAKWRPSEENKDPSKDIPGIVIQVPPYPAGQHVTSDQRVAYDHWPPYGGPHDETWADCSGVVYDKPVRTENMVHSLEHGAVWIAYSPDRIKDEALNKLKAKVQGIPYMMLSPFPGLGKPISLQSWDHQLKIEKADDDRIDQFISSLLRNPNTYPEVGASCDNPRFIETPAPFVAEAPGPDAVPMSATSPSSSIQPGTHSTSPPTN